ncbi:MAG: hypothetical protein HY852_17005 [Bradyrhizobium sp.]|uniref:hypothetical protein n=1 Tax=Bradyrhizobium sp. TaxID=376 RepID=UPI0025C33985|nr:hypothetical protein [Bradyrhizobium sp.]MBI5263511.1 hypothetical protein [Bradyrhizobium sp.]
MKPRGSTLALVVWGGLALAFAGCLAGAACGQCNDATTRELASHLALTDITLLNEARYTRNPALADLHSAFQDGPGSLDHFPAGSILAPSRTGPGCRLEVIDP